MFEKQNISIKKILCEEIGAKRGYPNLTWTNLGAEIPKLDSN